VGDSTTLLINEGDDMTGRQDYEGMYEDARRDADRNGQLIPVNCALMSHKRAATSSSSAVAFGPMARPL